MRKAADSLPFSCAFLLGLVVEGVEYVAEDIHVGNSKRFGRYRMTCVKVLWCKICIVLTQLRSTSNRQLRGGKGSG